MLRIDISEKSPDFPSNFLGFKLDTMEEQGIIYLSSNNSKSLTYVILSDSEITFLQER